MISIFIRTILIYVLLNVVLKIMGKRQIGELEVGELVSTLLISEIASIPISEPEVPLLNAVIPIVFICATEVAIAALKNRNTQLKRVIEGNSAYIIYKGRIRQGVLMENRISINELLTEMRIQGYGDIEEVEYGILEQNGKISLFEKGSSLAHPVVIDGEINQNAIAELGYNRAWLDSILKRNKARLEDIFLLEVMDDGEVKLVRRERNK